MLVVGVLGRLCTEKGVHESFWETVERLVLVLLHLGKAFEGETGSFGLQLGVAISGTIMDPRQRVLEELPARRGLVWKTLEGLEVDRGDLGLEMERKKGFGNPLLHTKRRDDLRRGGLLYRTRAKACDARRVPSPDTLPKLR